MLFSLLQNWRSSFPLNVPVMLVTSGYVLRALGNDFRWAPKQATDQRRSQSISVCVCVCVRVCYVCVCGWVGVGLYVCIVQLYTKLVCEYV
jgi:hypothetical protein